MIMEYYEEELDRKYMELEAPTLPVFMQLLEACEFALKELSDMTTDEFSKGADKELREKLAAAIASAHLEVA